MPNFPSQIHVVPSGGASNKHLNEIKNNQLTDFRTELSLGNIPDYAEFNLGSTNPSLPANSERTVWYHAGATEPYNFDSLVSPRDWAISSTEAADNQLIFVRYVADDWTLKTVFGVLEGKTKVSLGILARGIFSSSQPVSPTNPDGNVYVFDTAGTVGADGIPTDLTKVRDFIPATIPVAGAITNISTGSLAVATMPADRQLIIRRLTGSVDKGKNAVVLIKLIPFGFIEEKGTPLFHEFEKEFDIDIVLNIGAKSTVYFNVISPDAGASVTVTGQGWIKPI